MKRFALFFAFLVFVGLPMLQAQTVQITGKVTSSEDGNGVPGVSVVVKGSTIGTTTDFDGKYSLNVPSSASTLVFSFVGLKSQEAAIGGRNNIDIVLESDIVGLEEVVVTALGISKEKKSLGYATQEVKGDEMGTVKSANFINSLSGKVSGVQVKRNNNMGGSTNVIVRGSKSLTGSNQVLYVIDGVPISNAINNASGQNQAVGTNYDYGNAASDINPDDIESLNVLKGSAATALYGSRAANGVIMITTKKGTIGKKGIGVTVNSNVQVTSIDKSTFPEYQTQYGAGYGPFYQTADGAFDLKDFNGDGVKEEWVPTYEDASYGAKYDPNRMVYGWYSVDPESPWYNQARPWVNAKNGPITFFETPVTYTNSIAIENGSDKGSYRLSYTNLKTSGEMPNSDLKKNNFSVNGNWKVNNKLTAVAYASYAQQKAKGRNSTGYNDNILSNMRQWAQLDVDYADQKEAFFKTQRNLTWNYNTSLNAPAYTDNPYFQRYKNYENDSRDRWIGNMSLNYEIASWLNAYIRGAVDSYTETQEERRAVGSVKAPFGLTRASQGSGYLRRDNTYSEYNFDAMLRFDKNVTDAINLKGVVGYNERRSNYSYLTSSTSGGLTVPDIYSLQNSAGTLPFPTESVQKIGVRGMYADLTVGYKNFLYLEGTFRRDYSSTLPEGKNKYNYPSVNGSFVFTDIVNQNWLSLGKIYASYAIVGSGTSFDQLVDTYTTGTSFTTPVYSVPTAKKNPDLKPEKTKSVELGLNMNFFLNRVGFDFAYYQNNTFDQIMPVTLSQTTGYSSRWVNAGELDNNGFEVTLNLVPVKIGDFKWDMNINWSTNHSKVASLYPGITNLPLGSYQGGVTLNASVGEPYGALKGTDYTYDAQGNKIIDAKTGCPVRTPTSDHIIGVATPDWTGGINNSFSYKGLEFSFLIDTQHGGDIFSLDMYYGMNSGIYKETAFTNDLGNPVRDPLSGTPGNYDASSGGYLIQGVNVDANGVSTPNQTRVDASSSDYGFGYGVEPRKAFVYDASFIKLREMALSYNLPSKLLQKTFIKSLVVSVTGSNLWIIKKNIPYTDPEAGLSAGNLQGYTVGSLPTLREFGFNVKINF